MRPMRPKAGYSANNILTYYSATHTFTHRPDLRRCLFADAHARCAMSAGERQVFYDEPFIVPPESEGLHVHPKRRRLVGKQQARGVSASSHYLSIYLSIYPRLSLSICPAIYITIYVYTNLLMPKTKRRICSFGCTHKRPCFNYYVAMDLLTSPFTTTPHAARRTRPFRLSSTRAGMPSSSRNSAPLASPGSSKPHYTPWTGACEDPHCISFSVTNRSSLSIACAKHALAFELNLASCHIHSHLEYLSDSPACPQERSQPGCAYGALHAGSCRPFWRPSRGERTVAQSTPLCPWPAASAPGRRGTFVCRKHVVWYLYICQIT